MTITVGCPQTNRKTDTGKTLKPWPVLVDHYTIESEEELKFAVAFLDIWQRSQEHGVNFEQVLKDAIQQATPNEDRKWVSIK
ncbi:hypothetical protein ACLH2U_11730 [Citrobacter freundii]|uniref:hypothetical protein n=1 Tax=Citrobacter freundii TaxID=546 RepID=UPI0039839E37